MSYATAYEIGLRKKPINSNLSKENFINVIQTEPKQEYKPPSIPIHGSPNPLVWGPLFWYTLHNSAIHYPIEASPLVKQRIKNRILAIPYEISCKTCQPHASAYIESIPDSKLDSIVSGRDNLFKFYVDFHNSVNVRLGKPTWTYEQAYNQYGSK
jgi:hypothetical protein